MVVLILDAVMKKLSGRWGYLTQIADIVARDRYCPPTETVIGGRKESVVSEVDVIVSVLVCGR